LNYKRAASQSTRPFGQGFSFFSAIDIVDNDIGSLACEYLRNALSDSLGSARDQRYFVCQFHFLLNSQLADFSASSLIRPETERPSFSLT
jgi:hypothetical protein